MDHPRTDAQDFDLSARTSDAEDALQAEPADIDLEPATPLPPDPDPADPHRTDPHRTDSRQDDPRQDDPRAEDVIKTRPVASAMDAMLFNALVSTGASAQPAGDLSTTASPASPIEAAADDDIPADETVDSAPIKLFAEPPGESAADWEPLPPLMRIVPESDPTPEPDDAITVGDFAHTPLFSNVPVEPGPTPTDPDEAAAPAVRISAHSLDGSADASPLDDQVADDDDAVQSPAPPGPPPGRTGAWWTIPLLCAGLAITACAILVPAADENRQAMHELTKIERDVAHFEKQSQVNKQFLEHVSTDPALAERLALRQLRLTRPDSRIVPMPRKDDPFSMSPYALVSVDPPAPMPEYQPVGGVLADYCLDPQGQIYLAGLGVLLSAAGVILGGGAPRRENAVQL